MLQSLVVESECCSQCALQPLSVEVTESCRAPTNFIKGFHLTRVQQSVKVCDNIVAQCTVWLSSLSSVHCVCCSLCTAHCDRVGSALIGVVVCTAQWRVCTAHGVLLIVAVCAAQCGCVHC